MRSVLALLPLLAFGCGDDGEVGKLPDAFFESDAPVTPDTPPAVVKLTVIERGAPVANVPVYFQNADSSLVLMAPTDGSGVASATMNAGGFVTAINPFQLGRAGVSSNAVYTFAGVEPGDELRLDDGESTPTSVTVNLMIPTAANASGYQLYSSCARFPQNVPATGGPMTLDACGTGDLLVDALDASGNTTATLLATNVTIADQATIDLTGEAFVPAADRSFRYTGFEPGPTEVFTTPYAASARGLLHEAFANIGFEGGMGGRPLKVPAANALLATVVQSRFSEVQFGQHTVIDWSPSAATEWVLDGTNLLLPVISDLTSFDIATSTMAWAEAAGGQAPDASIVRIDFGRGGATFWDWHAVAPHAGTSLKLPTLPGDAAVWNPIADDAVFPDTLMTVKVPGGYDAVRPIAFSTRQSDLAFVTGATGRVVYQDYVAISAFARVAHEAMRRGRFTRTAR